MWIKASIVEDVTKVARVFYVDWGMASRWNEQRREGELRMMTGWVWTARDGSDERGGIKTQTAAYIDCWYRLVEGRRAPIVTRPPRLRLAADATKKVA